VDCSNQGRWECVIGECTNPDVDVNGTYCDYMKTDHSDCCRLNEIHYIDFWFIIDSGTAKWKLRFFNYELEWVVASGKVIINGTTFEDLYPLTYGEMYFVSMILRYNDTCETTLELYVNGVLIANLTLNHPLIISPFTDQKIFDMQSIGNKRLYWASAHIIPPTPERILELYELGPNRPLDEEICYEIDIDVNCSNICPVNCTGDCPCEECPECPPIPDFNCTLNCKPNGECVFGYNGTLIQKCRCFDGWDGDECDIISDIPTNCTLECPFNCTVDCPCPECPIIPVPDCSPHNCSGNGFC
jgi:hypothetical protein